MDVQRLEGRPWAKGSGGGTGAGLLAPGQEAPRPICRFASSGPGAPPGLREARPRAHGHAVWEAASAPAPRRAAGGGWGCQGHREPQPVILSLTQRAETSGP